MPGLYLPGGEPAAGTDLPRRQQLLFPDRV